MSDYLVLLGGAILVGWGLFQNKKRQSAEALLENQKVKEEVQKIEAEKQQNKADLKVEEQRREDVSKQTQEELNKRVSIDDILEFLNKPRE